MAAGVLAVEILQDKVAFGVMALVWVDVFAVVEVLV